ncbi:auxin-responsive protein SAUR76-like [Bidens hawaiensis]|uniref:auxin-responsive protein SAUR76-like n=1 Tax=Bidens hawaiensis TaxID=980011 RepID=UPI004049EB28
MKKINIILRKCKTLSKQLSSRSLGSNSARHHRGAGIIWNTNAVSVVDADEDEPQELVFVGSTRKRYVISSKYLNHPLVNALMEKPKKTGDHDVSVINCEVAVVLFDHLLWMLENADFNDGSDCFDELVDLYSS